MRLYIYVVYVINLFYCYNTAAVAASAVTGDFSTLIGASAGTQRRRRSLLPDMHVKSAESVTDTTRKARTASRESQLSRRPLF